MTTQLPSTGTELDVLEKVVEGYARGMSMLEQVLDPTDLPPHQFPRYLAARRDAARTMALLMTGFSGQVDKVLAALPDELTFDAAAIRRVLPAASDDLVERVLTAVSDAGGVGAALNSVVETAHQVVDDMQLVIRYPDTVPDTRVTRCGLALIVTATGVVCAATPLAASADAVAAAGAAGVTTHCGAG